MCVCKQIWVQGAEMNCVWAMEHSVGNFLDMPLAHCRTVLAKPVITLLQLPPPIAHVKPSGAAEMQQRSAVRVDYHVDRIPGLDGVVGALTVPRRARVDVPSNKEQTRRHGLRTFLSKGIEPGLTVTWLTTPQIGTSGTNRCAVLSTPSKLASVWCAVLCLIVTLQSAYSQSLTVTDCFAMWVRDERGKGKWSVGWHAGEGTYGWQRSVS